MYGQRGDRPAMQSLAIYVKHIPEGAETAVLVTLSVPTVMVAIRLLTGMRWAACFSTALVTFTYASLAAIPLLVLGSRLVGPISLALCPPAVLLVALIALRPIADLPGARRIWLAAAAAGILTGFGFVILVLPELRTSLRPEAYTQCRICEAHLAEIGGALKAYAGDHKHRFPDEEHVLDALTKPARPTAANHAPYLANKSALSCPAAEPSPPPEEAPRRMMLGDYVYARPARADPPDTYVLRCRRHVRVRRFWTERVGLYLRKDGRVVAIPIWQPRSPKTGPREQ
jgi:hypothetical protein